MRSRLTRVARLLTYRRARNYSVILVGVYVVAWCYVVFTGAPPLNNAGEPIGGDYIAFHTAGRLLLQGHGSQLYDRASVVAVQDGLLGGRDERFYDAFRNPPFAALPFVPLALLDLLPGFAVWTGLSLACLGLALRLLLQEVPELQARWRGVLLLVFAFAPVYFGIIDGENATVSLLLYVLLYRSLAHHQDGHAGVWAALGLFKPQLFFLFPIVFLANRRWRALATYAATAAILALVSLALVGADGLRAWLRILVEPESGNALANAWRMASLKSFMDVLITRDTTLVLELYVGACLLLLTGVAVQWASRSDVPRLRWALSSLVAVLIDPHLVDYDLSVLVPAGVFLTLSIPAARWFLLVVYALVVLRVQVPAGSSDVQFTPLALVACCLFVWLRMQPVIQMPSFGRGRLRRRPSGT